MCVYAYMCVYWTLNSRRCVGSLPGSSSILLAGGALVGVGVGAAGAWKGEEVEFGSGLADRLNGLLSCYE